MSPEDAKGRAMESVWRGGQGGRRRAGGVGERGGGGLSIVTSEGQFRQTGSASLVTSKDQ